MRGFKEWFGIIAKGFAMGTADLVPGVSGGTIAFITGIYEELISTIANLGPTTIRDLFKEGIVSTWKKYNINFLLALFIGIALAFLILSKTIHHLQETHPDHLMSFFLGLVLASTPLIWRSVGEKNKRNLGFGLLGVVAAAILTSLPTAESIESPIYIAFSGAVGICAMLLPGVSGSFILIILGAYAPVIAALVGFNFVIILAFAVGCITGLLAFSRLLKRVINNYHDQTLSVLVGFMLGALHVLWPLNEASEMGEITSFALWAVLGASIVTALDKLRKV